MIFSTEELERATNKYSNNRILAELLNRRNHCLQRGPRKSRNWSPISTTRQTREAENDGEGDREWLRLKREDQPIRAKAYYERRIRTIWSKKEMDQLIVRVLTQGILRALKVGLIHPGAKSKASLNERRLQDNPHQEPKERVPGLCPQCTHPA